MHTAFLVTLHSCATIDNGSKRGARKEHREKLLGITGVAGRAKPSYNRTYCPPGYKSELKAERQASDGFPKLECAASVTEPNVSCTQSYSSPLCSGAGIPTHKAWDDKLASRW